MPTGLIRTHLRHATAHAHARVDSLLASGFGTVDEYAAYLRAMHRFLSAVASVRPSPATGLHLARLQGDMAVLGVSPLPIARPPALPDGDAEWLAWRYVFEGSSLGARVLVRHAAGLGYTAAHGASFLATHAQADGWPALLHTLETLEPTPDELDRMGDAGNAAFGVVETALRAALQSTAEFQP